MASARRRGVLGPLRVGHELRWAEAALQGRLLSADRLPQGRAGARRLAELAVVIHLDHAAVRFCVAPDVVVIRANVDPARAMPGALVLFGRRRRAPGCTWLSASASPLSVASRIVRRAGYDARRYAHQ